MERRRGNKPIAVSNPPPKAVPWIAATIGFGQSSIALISSRKLRSLLRWPEVILPNSLMSAPAMNVRPPPIKTPPLIESSLMICSTAAAMPSGTPGLSALTGGLLTVMTPISPSRVKDTNSIINCDPVNENNRRVVKDNITYRSVGYDPCAGAVKTGSVKDRAGACLLDAGEHAVFKKTLPCASKRSFRHNRTASVRAVIQFRLCDED